MSSPKIDAHSPIRANEGTAPTTSSGAINPLGSDSSAFESDQPGAESPNIPTDANTANLKAEASSENETQQEVTAQLQAFLAGTTTDQLFLDSTNETMRQQIAAELIAVISPTSEATTAGEANANDDEAVLSRRNRARQVFVDHGYLDDVIQQLRGVGSAERRAEAARTLGMIRSQRGTAPLIAALFDEEVEVRNAATESLAQIGDPAVTMDPLNTEVTRDESEDSESPAPDESNNELTTRASDEEVRPVSRAELYPLTLGNDSNQTKDAESSSDAVAADGVEPIPLKDYDHAVQQIQELESRLRSAIDARNQAEKEVLLRLDQESRFRSEAAARRHEDEEARKKAEEKAARRRYEDERKLATEQLARIRVEEELQEFGANEDRLRQQLASARQAVEEMARLRAEAEIAEQQARQDEAKSAHMELLQRYNAEVAAFHKEEESLRAALEQTSLNRNEVEMARQGVELQTQRLAEETARLAALQAAYRDEREKVLEAENRNKEEQERLDQYAAELGRVAEELAGRRFEIDAASVKLESQLQEVAVTESRIRAAEEEWSKAQTERLQMEEALRLRTEEEQRLIEDLRRQTEEQETRLQQAASQRMEEYDFRLKDLEALKRQLEEDANRRTEEESLIAQQVEALRNDELELRKRVEEAEARRHAAEESNRVLAEQAQRIEAEAHMRSLDEERALAKLEEVRRNIELESQTRSAKVDKIKHEIDALRSFEEGQRRSIEEESRRRADIEARLQQEKERLRITEEGRVKAEALLETFPQNQSPEEPDRLVSTTNSETSQSIDSTLSTSEPANAQVIDARDSFSTGGSNLDWAAALPDHIIEGLNSAHPHKRASALTQLPALSAKDGANSFSLIVEYFDDPSLEVRNAAARALRDLEPLRPAESFTRALEDASSDRSRHIGKALASSGLAEEALNHLDSDNREETYNALCLLFVMAKTGEVQPLTEAIESHQDAEVRRAAIKLLNLSGQSELAEAAAKRRLGLSASAHSTS